MKKIYGADRDRLVLFGIEVQQSLSKTRIKRLTNLIGDNSLDGLVIDWHLANTERTFDIYVEPVVDCQQTYAYA